MRLRIIATLAILAAVGCAKPPPTFEDVPPAEELYAEGQKILDGGTWLWIIPRVKYTEAVETFQSIIDNYPYSEYAILAELAIADSYFEEEKYEEALSYYRDFADLHPQNEKVPYAIYRSALCHARRVESPIRDQTATRQALDFLRAPDRFAGLMDQGVLRWLIMPASRGGWRALELGSEALARVLRRLLGQGTVGEIASFFEAFRELGFAYRLSRGFYQGAVKQIIHHTPVWVPRYSPKP